MEHKIRLDPEGLAYDSEQDDERHDHMHEVTPDLAYKRLILVNVAFFGTPGDGTRWVLIDTGVPGSGDRIVRAAEERFGKNNPPEAILLTHGHFDHTGSVEHLAKMWQVPIYAHLLEFPYLNGTASYPAPDPTVGGGMMAALSGMYPTGPVNISPWLKPLPVDGSIPNMPGWRWMHTPGHSAGHVSFWRESDKTLLAGDAFTTTTPESAYAIATQRPELHGPPMYMTPDWESARSSVQQLSTRDPELVVTGHGPAMRGLEMRMALHTLAQHFDEIAIPDRGRYIHAPVHVSDGTAYVQHN